LSTNAREQYASSKRVYRQAGQYAAAYCITWILRMIATTRNVTSGFEWNFGVSILVVISLPLQEFINAIVYSSDMREQLGDIQRSIAS